MYVPDDERWSLADDQFHCEGLGPLCQVDGSANAWTVVDEAWTVHNGVDIYWLQVRAVRNGGAYNNFLRIGVPASSMAEARQLWALDADQLRAIATDPDLTIPEPVAWPATHLQ